jgi:hypothetical protein
MKIAYSHFLIQDRQLTEGEFKHLKALLCVPKCGEDLVQWGNSKYGASLTLLLAL